MSQVVIRIENLWKEYRIGANQGSQRTLREMITDVAAAPIKRLQHVLSGRAAHQEQESFWALREVSFEVRQGEVVGIIGRNGAGKSTLLKVLSRITEPTRGQVSLKGRVGALLEVGTGFHSELTGRENIYLNGALLGMKTADIRKRFDDIVAFSEVARFLDTPVKHYSSGMYMRLAFAVAAHLEPEVLIVDEVLAVGDSAFQKKCLGKIGEVATQGRTVLFVSHNANAVRRLCSRAVMLRSGAVEADGKPVDVLMKYERGNRELAFDATTATKEFKLRRGGGEVRFTALNIHNDAGAPITSCATGDAIRFVLSYEVFQPVLRLEAIVMLKMPTSREILASFRGVVSETPLAPGTKGTITFEIPNFTLLPGEYPLYYWLGHSSSYNYDTVDELTDPLVVLYSLEDQNSLEEGQGQVNIPFRFLGGRAGS